MYYVLQPTNRKSSSLFKTFDQHPILAILISRYLAPYFDLLPGTVLLGTVPPSPHVTYLWLPTYENIGTTPLINWGCSLFYCYLAP
jgi:hypothetical protein